MEKGRTLSPAQLEECAAMFRDAMEAIADHSECVASHIQVLYEVCPVLRIDGNEAAWRAVREGIKRAGVGV